MTTESVPGKPPIPVLYLSSTEFSGSTLLTFLLNTHPQIASVGHTMGWEAAADAGFTCSCGAHLNDCPVFRHVADAYQRNGLPFRADDFGTRFSVSSLGWMDYYLTEALPKHSHSGIEAIRDWLVRGVPSWGARLKRQHLTNEVFFHSVLEAMHSSTYLDNSHSPYRLRHLVRNPNLDVRNVHLIRDPRGVVLSMMTNQGVSLKQALQSWTRRQFDIYRISEEIPSLQVRYEDVCCDPQSALAGIYDFAGLMTHRFDGKYKDVEHHILGNRMRLEGDGIRLDERWRDDLTSRQRSEIDARLCVLVERHDTHPLSRQVAQYLER